MTLLRSPYQPPTDFDGLFEVMPLAPGYEQAMAWLEELKVKDPNKIAYHAKRDKKSPFAVECDFVFGKAEEFTLGGALRTHLGIPYSGAATVLMNADWGQDLACPGHCNLEAKLRLGNYGWIEPTQRRSWARYRFTKNDHKLRATYTQPLIFIGAGTMKPRNLSRFSDIRDLSVRIETVCTFEGVRAGLDNPWPYDNPAKVDLDACRIPQETFITRKAQFKLTT